MGATVVLLNRYDRVLRQALTNDKGAFIFDSLLPDFYAVRVSLSSFVPALKRNINVQPGLQSMLTINLATVLSSIELVYTAPPQGALMTDDWKWVLRSSQGTRPVLRYTDVVYREPRPENSHSNVFSDTRGLVRLSAGDGGEYAAAGSQPDLGTAFALATSLFGTNELQVSGNFGFSPQAGMPTAGFRTSYTRSGDALAAPEVIVTMRQLYLPSRGGFGATGVTADGPSLRTMTATFIDRTQVMDGITVDYGLTMDSVSMNQKLNTVSPFGRVNVDLGSTGLVQVAYSSGVAPTELAERPFNRSEIRDQDLSQDLAVLAALPLVSMRNGNAKVQRSDSMEVGYNKVAGTRMYSFGAYRERIKDALLTLASDQDVFNDDNLLMDLRSRSSAFNGGNFERWGYMASVSQALGDNLEVALAYGRSGGLSADHRLLESDVADDLRSALHITNRNWATVGLSGTAPVVGTHFSASYGWMDTGTLMPVRVSLTQQHGSPQAGLNLSVRQPIPSGGLPGRLEAVGEMRNLMAQGYLPMTTGSGRSVLLTNSPRAVRGGLSFIF